MIVLGLTGSIGMGKSTAAAMLRRHRIPVFDADAEVHRLLAPGGAAVSAVLALFPGVVATTGAIDRQRLGQEVFGNPNRLKQLEAILHPLVRAAEHRFIQQARGQRRRMIVLDIPLLFEAKREGDVDAVVVVTAPAFLQRQRVLRRPGMTPEKFNRIKRLQIPDRIKRQRADIIVETGLGRGPALRHLKAALRRLTT